MNVKIPMNVNTKRRTLLKGIGAGAAVGTLGGLIPRPVRAQTPVKVGYLHTLAVDGQIWLGDHMGTWKEQGLDMEFIQFTTGLELFQAMIGGSLDMLATGAVISNFPARGRGQAFLINNIEWGTAQLWVHPDMGVNSIQDLKGRKISTTIGTTAHVFLHRALKSAGLDPQNDVTLVNQRMSDAVTTFISGAVPAVALWVPFNIAVREQVPEAKMLVDASKFYPESAIIGGWAARNDFYRDNPQVIDKVIKGWVPANDFLVSKPEQALQILHDNYYQQVPLAELTEQYQAQKVFLSEEWVPKYKDGTVTNWLSQVTGFFESIGAIDDPVPATEYFHPEPYIEIVG